MCSKHLVFGLLGLVGITYALYVAYDGKVKLDIALERADYMRHELDSLGTKLRKVSDDKSKLAKDCGQCRTELKKMQTLRDQMQEEFSTLTNSKNELAQRQLSLEAELSSARHALQLANQELAERQANQSAATASQAELAQSVTRKDEEIAELRRTNTDLSKRASEMEAILKKQSSSPTEVRQQSADKSQIVTTTTVLVTTLESTNVQQPVKKVDGQNKTLQLQPSTQKPVGMPDKPTEENSAEANQPEEDTDDENEAKPASAEDQVKSAQNLQPQSDEAQAASDNNPDAGEEEEENEEEEEAETSAAANENDSASTSTTKRVSKTATSTTSASVYTRTKSTSSKPVAPSVDTKTSGDGKASNGKLNSSLSESAKSSTIAENSIPLENSENIEAVKSDLVEDNDEGVTEDDGTPDTENEEAGKQQPSDAAYSDEEPANFPQVTTANVQVVKQVTTRSTLKSTIKSTSSAIFFAASDKRSDRLQRTRDTDAMDDADGEGQVTPSKSASVFNRNAFKRDSSMPKDGQTSNTDSATVDDATQQVVDKNKSEKLATGSKTFKLADLSSKPRSHILADADSETQKVRSERKFKSGREALSQSQKRRFAPGTSFDTQ